MERDVVERPKIAFDIDACWNRIGTRGDRSCERLDTCQRCLNCPVFERHAALLLDRPLTDADLADAARLAAERALRANPAPAARDGEAETVHSALAFRVADEWLALPIRVLREITDTRSIHPLPHRRNRAVLGIVNVRGMLRVAVSLAELLSLDARADRAAPRTSFTRMLVVAHRGDPVVFPVDEVEGVLRFTPADWMPVPATVARAGAVHSRGVFAWRGKTIGLLDEERLFDSLTRSLR
ncbi:chemotaxis protein CheW [Burkholderia thailandensis]|uniref:Chemotaxis protein CheW n=1 Tax=Burkholderia thailandensis (strain ATCC 700388 / DSM 13276 / CCUG 48851 / CIP 106301 / E264) TaxID=271848 RepID=Q2T7Z5_BURTA|nr:chemotaxis protein CheW [Burkholderia thailandensis]ABC36141.1 chemotaxis protein cheW [Burkholderia thailandensis E264]AHI76474.1 cheW-like domain protein [Burkholderia thailandensis 2002721723]AHI81612.1 cheW-like domain protein [Burkholderia thailandensis E444]AIC89790.1 cheW-like domain protein [Burkholderia thailandensis USAMRU Malaysia \